MEVKIPAVGESITSGIVSVWHKKSGDFVNAGDALFTLETDKVSTEITAEKGGVLETRVPAGQEAGWITQYSGGLACRLFITTGCSRGGSERRRARS